MADTISTVSSLLFEASFVDGDTRTLTVKNPKADISLNEIEAFNTFLVESNILVGDRAASTYRKIASVRRRRATTTKLEINQ